jgi:hypothetical protein
MDTYSVVLYRFVTSNVAPGSGEVKERTMSVCLRALCLCRNWGEKKRGRDKKGEARKYRNDRPFLSHHQFPHQLHLNLTPDFSCKLNL